MEISSLSLEKILVRPAQDARVLALREKKRNGRLLRSDQNRGRLLKQTPASKNLRQVVFLIPAPKHSRRPVTYFNSPLMRANPARSSEKKGDAIVPEFLPLPTSRSEQP